MEVAAPTHVLMVRGSRSVKTERRLVGGLMQAVALEYGLKLAVCEHAVFDALAAGLVQYPQFILAAEAHD